MSSKDVRPSSAQSRQAWGLDPYASGGHARPDNQFDFGGPRDDPDLPSAMENDMYADSEPKRNNDVSPTTPKKSGGCWSCFTSGLRCKFRFKHICCWFN